MLRGAPVVAGVVGHPSGHLGQRGCCGEDLRAAAEVDQPGHHPARQVPDDGPVQPAAAGLPVSAAEVVHGHQVVTVRRRMVGPLMLGSCRRRLPRLASQPQQMTGDVEGVGDLLEQRQLLYWLLPFM
ncbi:hypothetical protein J2Z21_009726 [Streptomyces griseochromogenes]|uniref:Uncharacterized protein n=1 Tax=Streptomyces griseochromogenes TaxID=68214 RepID=A0ABS4MAK2_9ACTN|nr:hypothetical protein [Streptomyces griseochromogenes]MBP2056707.1 hypothetical protein [Streptomyces griseochromogenes]